LRLFRGAVSAFIIKKLLRVQPLWLANKGFFHAVNELRSVVKSSSVIGVGTFSTAMNDLWQIADSRHPLRLRACNKADSEKPDASAFRLI
jgi:hypothetical protein